MTTNTPTEEWYASCDGEIFGDVGPFDSREDAIALGGVKIRDECNRDPGTKFFVGLSVPWDLPTVDADMVIEQARLEAYDAVEEWAEDWLDRVPEEQLDALTERLTEVFHKWLAETGNVPTFYRVTKISEHVVPAPEEAK